MSGDSLVLRDIHQAQPAPFWPPAPGWWLLLAVIVLLIAGMMLWRRHRLTRKRRVAALFDDAMQAAGSPVARIAAMSDLLRRASRRIDAKADTLEGDDWLAFLDRGLPEPHFSQGPGRLLVDGGFRPEVSEQDSTAVEALARQRFIAWMGG